MTPTSGPPRPRCRLGSAFSARSRSPPRSTRPRRLQAVVHQHQIPFGVAYTYTGFPMVMLARTLVQDGSIGSVRKVEAWYPQGWLASNLEADGQKQAAWRVDPTKAGASGCGGDIGTHAYEFVRFVGGASATRLSARLTTFVQGRALDDDFTVLAELDNGGIATIAASQITIGAQNDNGFRVSGTSGTLEWSITDHNVLKLYSGGQPVHLYRLGADYKYFPSSIQPYIRVPSGHPEGFPRGARQPPHVRSVQDPEQAGRSGAGAVRAPGDRRRRCRDGLSSRPPSPVPGAEGKWVELPAESRPADPWAIASAGSSPRSQEACWA